MELEKTQATKAKQKFNNSAPVQVKRTFHSPVDRVWKAWSDPELTKQWWGPYGFKSPSAKIDFHVGGKYLLAMQAPDGKVTWSAGELMEIIPYKKIIWTDHFSDKDGHAIPAKEAGMTGDWPEELYVTIKFESVSKNETKMVLSHEGIPRDMHDECAQGWRESFDKLQKLIERN